MHERRRIVGERRRLGEPARESWLGLNLAFTKDGLTQPLGANRPKLDPSFERGADHPHTVEALNDPPPAKWLQDFVSDRIDGVFLITGPNPSFVTYHGNILGERLGMTIKPVYSEIAKVRPGRERGHEHFGFHDGISQPGIRGLTPVSRPGAAPNQGLPGQDLVWPGEFILGYPGQDPLDAVKPGPVAPLPAPWARNGSYMVFRRLEQRVPEFRAFVAAQAARLGMDPDLLAARMVGRWRSGAPLELAPLEDKAWLGRDAKRNNDFSYAEDPFQRACPYAAHIRKLNPAPRCTRREGRDPDPPHHSRRHSVRARTGARRNQDSAQPGIDVGALIRRRSRDNSSLSRANGPTLTLSAARCVPTVATRSRQASTRSSGSPPATAPARWTSPIRTIPPATGEPPSICRANLSS